MYLTVACVLDTQTYHHGSQRFLVLAAGKFLKTATIFEISFREMVYSYYDMHCGFYCMAILDRMLIAWLILV